MEKLLIKEWKLQIKVLFDIFNNDLQNRTDFMILWLYQNDYVRKAFVLFEMDMLWQKFAEQIVTAVDQRFWIFHKEVEQGSMRLPGKRVKEFLYHFLVRTRY